MMERPPPDDTPRERKRELLNKRDWGDPEPPSHLPPITKIETTARVGEERRAAVVIWFGGECALRYVWVDDSIEEQTYFDGVVHDALDVDGERDELADYALESVAEYIHSYRDDPHACQKDWPHVYEMLVAVLDNSNE